MTYVRTEEHRQLQAERMRQAWDAGRKKGVPCLTNCSCKKHFQKGKRCLPGCICPRHTAFFGGPVADAFARVLKPAGFVREFKVSTAPTPGAHYNLDFAEPRLRINVELDGPGHFSLYDKERDARLRQLGWLVVRITHA